MTAHRASPIGHVKRNGEQMNLRPLAAPRVLPSIREREAERHRLSVYVIRIARARRQQRRAERRLIEAQRLIRAAPW